MSDGKIVENSAGIQNPNTPVKKNKMRKLLKR